MSSNDVLVSTSEDTITQQPKTAPDDQKAEEISSNGHPAERIINNDEKPPQDGQKARITYTMEKLLEIKVKKESMEIPEVLDQQFLKDGIWDPEAWHRSSWSRSSSPMIIDGKTVLAEGKKIELIGDDIELAPKRQSFKQGCQVKTIPNVPIEKQSVDKTRRLTGRPANQRRNFETNYKDGESISAQTHEFEKMRKSQGYDRDRNSQSNDRYGNSNERTFLYDKNYYPEKPSYNNKHNTGRFQDEKHHNSRNDVPEWMTDGPTSYDDTMNFFSSQIEEEKKAFAAKSKKKKVRISPDVETQIVKKEKPNRKNLSSNLKGNEQNGQEKNFDINQFIKGVEYYPPQMHSEESGDGGVRSRFTQFFQTQEQQHSRSSSRNSRPPSGALIPDEVITGPPISPAVSQAFFAPIQPAPALVSAAANAHAVQTSNIANIIERHRHEQLLENVGKAKREVRGSMSVEELEGLKTATTKSALQPSDFIDQRVNHQKEDNSAFNMFLLSMKDAGQLPDKPSPIVSGLPGHLLPQPPTRTSPVFEKLKRSLSRSPSPKDFAKAVSTVATIISTNPTIDKELAILKQTTTANVLPAPIGKSRLDMTMAQTPKTPSHSQLRDSTASPSIQSKKTPMNAFTPTSVLKKMHNEKKDDNESKPGHPDVSNVNVQNNDQFPDVLPDQARHPNSEKRNLDSQFIDAAITPDRLTSNNAEISKFMPFHSAPVTPKNHFSALSSANGVSLSAPGTPSQHKDMDPPAIQRLAPQPSGLLGFNVHLHESAFNNRIDQSNNQGERVLLAPSAFKAVSNSNPSKNDLGVIGSGIKHISDNKDAYNKFVNQLGQMNLATDRASPRQMAADPKLAPGNGARHHQMDFGKYPVDLQMNQHNINHHQLPSHLNKPQSQQQQLLQAQRMAQIHQAQLLQQQKLQEIAKLGKQENPQQDNMPGPFRPLLPDPEKFHAHQPPRRPLYQQQQHQQVLAYQQQQQQQQQQLLRQHHQRGQLRQPGFTNPSHVPGQPPLPLPMHPNIPGLQPFQQPPMNPVNLAAQALVQQQLINQAARARLFAQATLIQQQPQVMQAALMAQAALVRGQAQAQAAMMLNPRNLQAMAEQMGLRQPFNSNKQHNKKTSTTPMAPLPDHAGSKDGETNSVLSKWFSNDVLQQMPIQAQANPVDANKSRILSVEELERGQK